MKKIGIMTVGLLLSGTSFAQQASQLTKNNINEVVSAMTLDEKIRFVSGIGMANTGGDGAAIGRVEGTVPGSAGATFAIERLGIPSVIVADGPSGLRVDPISINGKKRYPTAFPIGSLMASTWNKQLVEQAGEAMGNEVSEFGVDIILAPGMNIIRNPLCGRNFEYYSEDPVLAGNIATAIVKGIQKNNVGTAIKHFTANNQETNRVRINAKISERALREIYLRPFEIAVKKAMPWTIMTSYNKINDVYTSESSYLLTDILRKEWKYDGIVMTDWFAGENIEKQVSAGNDLIMPGGENNYTQIKAALEKGTLKEDALNRNVKRILELIVKTKTFEKYAYANNPDLERNARISQHAAEEGMVLLKNENGTLPFKVGKVALLGNASYDTYIGGTGSGGMKTAHVVSFYDGLAELGFSLDPTLKDEYLTFIKEEKAKRPKQTQMFEKLQDIPELPMSDSRIETMAQECDYALVTIGRIAGEGYDRSLETDYMLRPKELELISKTANAFHKKGKKIAVALNIDALVDMTAWRDKADAILITWLPGQEAGLAFANIVSGKTNPSGKLTQTSPLSYSDLPSASTFGGVPKSNPTEAEYNEGVYVGYRYFSTQKKPVAYPFGYGLSYSTFSLGGIKCNLQADKVLHLSVDVKNTGLLSGKEVVQVYVSSPKKAIDRPAIELKAFEKTTLLQPKEKQTLNFIIPIEDLAYYDESCSEWVIEKGKYTVKVGTSSENLPLTATFIIKE